MSTPTDARHPFELLLSQLTGAMGVRHDWGTVADASHTSEDRIVWIPKEGNGIGYAPRRFTLPNKEITGLQLARFDVSIYGGSPTAVYQSARELGGWLDWLAGPPQGSSEVTPPRAGYDFTSDGKVEPRGGDAMTTGWGCTLSVVLKDFIVRREHPLGTVIEATDSVVVTDMDGGSEEVAIQSV